MKIKEGYILRTVAGMHIAVPVSAKSDFDGMITLNETALFLWKKLETGCTKESLVQALTNEYDVDEEKARTDLNDILQKFREMDIITDD